MNDIVTIKSMTPATGAQTSELVARMFLVLASPNKDGLTKAVAKEYLDSVKFQPEWAIKLVSEKFRHGRYDWHDGKFVPNVAQFARAVADETKFAREQIRRQKQLAEQRKETKSWHDNEAAKTPETRAKVQALLEKTKRNLSAPDAPRNAIYGPSRSEVERTNQRFNPQTQTYKAQYAKRGQ